MSGMDLLSASIYPSTENELQFDTQTGRKKVTPEEYINLAQSLQPDMLIQPFPEVNGYSQKKRIAKSVNHSTQLARNCLSNLKTLRDSMEDNIQSSYQFWPVVSGGTDSKARDMALKDFNGTFNQYQELIGGVLLAGLGLGETTQQRFELIEQCMVIKIMLVIIILVSYFILFFCFRIIYQKIYLK